MTEHSAAQVPCGYADPEEEVAYIVGPQGRIHLLDLTSGETMARTEFAGTPLTIGDGVLIGWAPAPDQHNAVRLFALVQDGDVLRPKWETELQLPDWVETVSSEPNAFMLQAEIEKERVAVTWGAHARYRGGAPPPPRVEEAATHEERRTLQLDCQTGKLVGKEHVEAAPRPEQALPALTPDRRLVPYFSGTSRLTRPWRAGLAESFLVKTGREPEIVLVRESIGRKAGPVEIRLTEDPAAEAAVTPDGGLIFIHEPAGITPVWHVFSAETGERIASLPFDAGTRGVAVVNERVLYLVVEEHGTVRRWSLRCRNLHTTEAMWSYFLKEDVRSKAPPLPP